MSASGEAEHHEENERLRDYQAPHTHKITVEINAAIHKRCTFAAAWSPVQTR